MSKNTRTRILLTAVAALLLVVMAVGGTLAWLVDTTEKVENTFTTTDIEITLDEASAKTFELIPGTTYEKNPVATVKAGSENCYLYVEVVEAGTIEGVIEYAIREGWTKLTGVTGPNGGTVYYWKDIITQSTADTPIYILAAQGTYSNGGVVIPDTLTDENMEAAEFKAPKLTFYAYAIQSDNTGSASDAWTKLIAQEKPTT